MLPGVVLVVGSANIDLLLRVDALPQAGQTVLGADAQWRPGGKGANQAVAAALYGARVRLLGCVGEDEQGRTVSAALREAGVDTGLLVVADDDVTGLAVVLVARDGENAIAVSPGANRGVDASVVRAAVADLGPRDVLLAQLEIPLDVVVQAIAAGAAAGARTVLNLAPAARVPAGTLALLDVLVVNLSEAEFLLGRPLLDREDCRGAAAELVAGGPAAVVLTAGADGAFVADRSAPGIVRHVPAEPVTVVDTAGAGDAFVGALCARLATGDALDVAVREASRAGAAAVQVHGAQLTRATDPDS